MKRRRSRQTSSWSPDISSSLVWSRFLLVCLWIVAVLVNALQATGCPPPEAILPCRCSLRGKEIQIWCSHSNLPQIMDGIKAVEHNIKGPIDELVLENNQLPALPGRFFGTLQIVRLMLRYNSIERVSNGWLNELENSLVEIYIVEPQLRSIPVESLNGMINMIAITIQSNDLKYLPDFSGLLSLSYLSVQSQSLNELQPHWFRHLPKMQNLHVNGGVNLNRLEAGIFDGLISLKNIDLSRNGINWIHLRAFSRLPNLLSLKLSYNEISDVGMVGRIVKDLENLKKLRLDHNNINIVEDGSFVGLPHLMELHLNDNHITELQYGAFLRTPMLRTIYLHNNHIKRIHPESFLQASGSGVETVYIYNNEIEHVNELRSLMEALPTLKFLDMSNNYLTDIPYGTLRGHGTLEQLHLNNNLLRAIERDALMAMPALRELRMRNNSLTSELPMPFWNLPDLKGLDLSQNNFRIVDSHLLAGLPSLRRLDLSENGLSELDPSTFIHNPMLETLNISANELVSVRPATFRNLNHLFEIDASFNQLVEIIPGLPEIVERVSVRGNLIATLPVASSKALSLPNLRMLDLSGNRLEQLPKYSFQGTPQLRVLSLANNRLRTLDDTAFIGAQRLELLHLQENELEHIDERTFLPLSELRNLNLQGNKLEAITDNMFSNNSRLDQLDLSRNNIRTISPTAFEAQRALEYLDLSGNMLSDVSVSLSNLKNLRDIDLSYNKISHVHADVVSAWRNVVEVRLANNLIVELKHGTFRNLPKLQYLDLSSNEISSVESSALKQLPDLQEFVLADNKLVELKDHVFEDLPNLLASHFQYNMLRFISPGSFHNSPSMVFLNLSNNNFRNMENIGLRSMRNLEVLDLSMNEVKVVSTMPLKALNWLVELKMDNNRICKIQGTPFETMPRLRVLSMRNNRLRTIRERTFRNLRGNIAILDVDGNPIVCSCEMQWLSVWLQETNFPHPGPKCQDGRLLRASRISKELCTGFDDTNQRKSGYSPETDGGNHLPLLNEHGDIFQRELQEELNDECDLFEETNGERPLPPDSEYFYEQYVDYAPTNETSDFPTDSVASGILDDATNNLVGQRKKPMVSPNIDLNNTILHTNYFKIRPPQATAQTTSPFTFFGYPIPSLSLGRFFGAAQLGRKDRSELGSSAGHKSLSPVTSTSTKTMAATHRMQSSRGGKGRKYQPNSAEFEKYLNQDSQYQDVTARNRYLEANSDESDNNKTPHSVFKTTFREPSSVERGGFRPIVPEQVGGFKPVHNPHVHQGTAATSEVSATTQKHAQSNDERTFVPVITADADKIAQRVEKNTSSVTTTQHVKPPSRKPTPTRTPELKSQTYYVTEATTELTTSSVHRITAPRTTAAISSDPTTTAPPINAMSSADTDLYDDLEAESVGLLKPPPLPQTTTAETILLIPPPQEHVEQFHRHTWVTTTAATVNSDTADDDTLSQPRPVGGRSTITKVHTPQTLSQYLPTAEEYYRTTPSNELTAAANTNKQLLLNAHRDESSAQQLERVDRKDGMDWYYESFKKKRSEGNADYVNPKHVPAGGSLYGKNVPNLSKTIQPSPMGVVALVLMIVILETLHLYSLY